MGDLVNLRGCFGGLQIDNSKLNSSNPEACFVVFVLKIQMLKFEYSIENSQDNNSFQFSIIFFDYEINEMREYVFLQSKKKGKMKDCCSFITKIAVAYDLICSKIQPAFLL